MNASAPIIKELPKYDSNEKVKNYLDLLIELGSGIKHDKSGYWMK